jgi:hypothetical protein
MPVVDVLRTMVLAGIATTGVLANPSELVIDDIPGFELTSAPAVDLTYEEYVEREPDSVAHLDPESDAAAGMLAAIEVWTGRTADDVIVVELIRAIDEQTATTFVDQAAANSIAVGLAATDPPFGGAWSYSGAVEDGWTNIVAWNQGPYAVMLTQRTAVETDRETIDPAAIRQVEIILGTTGAEVSDAAAVADDAPTAPTEAPPPEETTTGGFPVGTFVLVLAVVGVAAGVLLQQRRKYPGSR